MDRDPEDGISHRDLQTLFDKKVQTWNDMWLIIFPDWNQDIPYSGKVVLEVDKPSEPRVAVGITKWYNEGPII